MNLGSNFNKKKRKEEVQNKTKWKNSFGGKRLSGGKKSRRKKGKEKRTKNRGKIFLLGGGYNRIANRKRKKKEKFFNRKFGKY